MAIFKKNGELKMGIISKQTEIALNEIKGMKSMAEEEIRLILDSFSKRTGLPIKDIEITILCGDEQNYNYLCRIDIAWDLNI